MSLEVVSAWAIFVTLGIFGTLFVATLLSATIWVVLTMAVAVARRQRPDWKEFL